MSSTPASTTSSLSDEATAQQEKEEKRQKAIRDATHKQLRELLENIIQFLALFFLLLWASDHVQIPAPNTAAQTIQTSPSHPSTGTPLSNEPNLSLKKFLLRAAAALCLVPGAILRLLCVFTNKTIEEQIKKECPTFSRRLYQSLDLYRLTLGATFIILLFGGMFLASSW